MPLQLARRLWQLIKRRFESYPNNILSLGIVVMSLMLGGLSMYLAQLEFHALSPRPPKAVVKEVAAAQTTAPVTLPTPTKVAAPAKPVNPKRVGQYGFSAGDLHGLSSAELEARLTDFNAIGVSWIRFDVQWNHIQEAGPTSYDWSGYDRVVASAQKHNLKILMILDYTPAWARRAECSDDYHCAPNDNARFAQYAADVVRRYSPQGVKHWEIWNEPNHTGFWGPVPDPVAYTELLIKTHAAIKSVDSSAFVLTGGMGVTYTEGTSIGPADFITSVYKNGGRGSFDGVGHHPYTYPALATLNEAWTGWYQMQQVRSIMVAQGDAGKPIWLTEYGAPTKGPGAVATQQNFNFENHPDHVDEALQKEMAIVAFNSHESLSWSGPLFWYGYKDLGTSTNTNENFFGLVRADGTRKPIYETFKALLH